MESDTGPGKNGALRHKINFTSSIPPLLTQGGNAISELGPIPGIRRRYTGDLLYLFLAVLGLCCCTGFALVAKSGVHALVAEDGLLTSVASLIAEHGL